MDRNSDCIESCSVNVIHEDVVNKVKSG
ncbi:MAG TPA: transcriptional regulator, partial [Clostridiaceae bacterium]|nr:transcriptional regulator [Clostridiaceae bacterium]HBG38559.1 transcriptional regulator [Clostridiaceae bacterium]HBN29070.1 transcriptional regulator [Clostridiaceae bacterium]